MAENFFRTNIVNIKISNNGFEKELFLEFDTVVFNFHEPKDVGKGSPDGINLLFSPSAWNKFDV